MAPTTTTLDEWTNDVDSLPPAPDCVDDPTEAQQQMLADRAEAHAVETVAGTDYEDVIDPEAINWETSTNSQRTRRAGDCRGRKGPGGEITDVTITLTWQAYAAWGWEEFSGTVRHELAHAVDYHKRGTSDHGLHFEMLANDLDAPVECKRFADTRLTVRCGEGCEDHRSKASKLVKDPEGALCKRHGEQLRLIHNDSGRSWTTAEGYQQSRSAIEASDEVEW